MAARFTTEFYDIDGQQYLITIYDDGYAGASVEQTLKGHVPGFELVYESEDDQPYQGVITSTLTMHLVNEGGSFDTWLQSIPSITGENDITITLEWKNSGTYQLEWAGVLMVDQIELEDMPSPSLVKLVANDGLGYLKTVKSTLTQEIGGIEYLNSQSIKDWLIELLTNTKSAQHWQSTDKFLRAWADFNPDGWGVDNSSSGLNILEYSQLYGAYDPNTINVISGVPEAYSNWTFLQSICMLFNARLCQANGEWHFWPVNQHILHAEGTSYATEHKVYTKAGQPTSETSAQETEFYTRTTPQLGDPFTSNRYVQLSGGSISHTIPYKSFRRARPYRGQEAINLSIRAGGSSAINVNANGLGLVDFSDPRSYFTGAKLLISGNIAVQRAANGSTTGPADLAQLRIKCNLDVGSYRYDPANSTWTTDQSTDRYFFIGTLGSISGGINSNLAFSILTVGLPADSETLQCDIDADFINGLGASLNTTFSAASPATLLSSFITTQNTNDAFQNLLMFQGESSLDNTEPFDQGQLIFGTVPDVGMNSGLLFVQNTHNSATYEWDASTWISSQSTSGAHINRLGVREAIALTQNGMAKRSGQIKIPGSMRIPSPLMTIKNEAGDAYFLTTSISYTSDQRIASISRLEVEALDFTNISDNGLTGEATDSTGNDGSGTGSGTGSTNDDGSKPGPVGIKTTSSNSLAQHILFDEDGVILINAKSGQQPISADDVDDGSTTNKFATSSQLSAISSNTASLNEILGVLKATTGGGGQGVYTDSNKGTTSSYMGLTSTGATLQAGSNTNVGLTETSPGTITLNVQGGSSGNEAEITAMTIAGDGAAQAARITMNQPVTFASGAAGIDLNDLDDVNAGSPSDGQALAYDSASSKWTAQTISGGSSGLADVVDDTTPQLGGNLDLNGNNISGTGNINTTGTLTTSGLATLPGIFLGSTGILGTGAIQTSGSLTTTGSGNLSIAGTSSFAGNATFSQNLYASGLQFTGSGTNTIGPSGTGGSQDDLEIRSNGNVTVVLDYDSNEAAQAFIVKNQAGTVIFQVDEDGTTSGLLTTATPTISGLNASYSQSASVTCTVGTATTGRTFTGAIYNSSGVEQTSNPVTIDSSGNVSFTAPSTVATGWELRIYAVDAGKLKSVEDIESFDTTATRTFTHWRIRAVDSSGNDSSSKAAWVEIDFYTGANQSGTVYPTSNATSNTSISGVTISDGYHYGSYEPWRAFNGSTHGSQDAGSMWWTLSTSAANNWLQLEFSSAQTFQSMRLTAYATFNDATHFHVEGSNTGNFSGEEVIFSRTAIVETSPYITNANF